MEIHDHTNGIGLYKYIDEGADKGLILTIQRKISK